MWNRNRLAITSFLNEHRQTSSHSTSSNRHIYFLIKLMFERHKDGQINLIFLFVVVIFIVKQRLQKAWWGNKSTFNSDLFVTSLTRRRLINKYQNQVYLHFFFLQQMSTKSRDSRTWRGLFINVDMITRDIYCTRLRKVNFVRTCNKIRIRLIFKENSICLMQCISFIFWRCWIF